MKNFRMWYARWFQVISTKQAEKWKLTFVWDIHGDLINTYNCRSLWEDEEGRLYRVFELKN